MFSSSSSAVDEECHLVVLLVDITNETQMFNLKLDWYRVAIDVDYLRERDYKCAIFISVAGVSKLDSETRESQEQLSFGA